MTKRKTVQIRRDNPASRALDSETFDRASDNILNAMEAAMLPFLQFHAAATVADRLLERLNTHFKTELTFIRTGKSSDALGEYTSAKTFRERFLEQGGILR